jgi:Protein of unknown function (DUF3455)
MNLNIRAVRPAATLAASGVLAAAALLVSTVVHAQGAGERPAPTPPSVPADIQVPPGNQVALVGHAVGTQNYVCLPADSGYRFVLFTPQATLVSDDDVQLTTHYFSPNPSEGGTIRATWQDSRTTSAVWGQAIQSSSDPGFVATDAIPWVLLRQVGARDGQPGSDPVTEITFIQRVNTSGGIPPSNGCGAPADIGRQVFVPYSADYVFYSTDT